MPRMMNARKRSALVGAALVALTAVGCAPEIGGRATFPVMSKGTLPGYTPVGQVDEKRCTHVVLFFAGWGEDANHEALITDILVKHQADAIGDAELTFFSIPAFFYNQSCARVRGTVLRRGAAGVERPAEMPPVGPPPVTPAAPVPQAATSTREVTR